MIFWVLIDHIYWCISKYTFDGAFYQVRLWMVMIMNKGREKK